MSTTTPPTPPARTDETGQMARLMQYTIFHIGAYITLAGVALAVLERDSRDLLLMPILLFLLAGVTGSVVGSNLPRYVNYEEFMAARIGIGGRPHLAPARWMAIEHLSFWAGLLSGLAIIVVT